MSGFSRNVPSTRGTSMLVRPRFAPGMLLQHDDLDLISSYSRDVTRLLFRSFFGCGVVCGLVVKPESQCGQSAIVVGPGLGLDCAGDPIHVPKATRVVLDEDCQPNPNDRLWVVLCAVSKCCAPRPSMCPDDDDEDSTSCTREREGFEIRVVATPPRCACSCVSDTQQQDPAAVLEEADPAARIVRDRPDCRCADPNDPCYSDHYLGICGCGCDDCARGAGCDCVLLAMLTKAEDGVTWDVDHRVRRFIRPVLARDPALDNPTLGKVSTAEAATAAPAAKRPAGKPAATTPALGGLRTRKTSRASIA